MAEKVYELHNTVNFYSGGASSAPLTVFIAPIRDKEYTVELILLSRTGSGGQVNYRLERLDGATVIIQGRFAFADFSTVRIPGPFHFIGTDAADQQLRLVPDTSATHTFLSSFCSVSEE